MESKRNQCFLKSVDDPKSPPKQFTFDGVYFMDSITETIYNDVGFALVESVIKKTRLFQILVFNLIFMLFKQVCEGYNGTVFAYGQTGCGKS